MSARIERRLRNRTINDNLSATFSKSKETRKSNGKAADFSSETLSSSSPFKIDVASEKRIRKKKKIRSTDDFNYLRSSFSSQDSDEPTKITSKTTKKSKRAYNLPKISQVAEELFVNQMIVLSDNEELIIKKRNEGKTRKRSNRACIDVRFNDKETSDFRMIDNLHDCKDNLDSSNGKSESNDEYESANSVISVKEQDSEVEINTKIKLKKTLNKHKDTNTDIKKFNDYTQRIKKPLINVSVTPKNINQNQSSVTSLTEEIKLKSPSVKISAEINQTPQKIHSSNVKLNSPFLFENKQNTNSKLSSTPYPMKKFWLDNNRKGEMKLSNLRSENILSDSFSPEFKSKKTKNKKSSSSHQRDTFCADKDYDEQMNTKDTCSNQNTSTKRELILNDPIQTRKSVRFKSPEKYLRGPVIFSKSNKESVSAKSETGENHISSDIFLEGSCLSSEELKMNCTFEIASPKLLNYSPSDELCNNSNQSHEKDKNMEEQISLSFLQTSKKSGSSKRDFKTKNSLIDVAPTTLKEDQIFSTNEQKRFTRASRTTNSLEQNKDIQINAEKVSMLIRRSTFTIDEDSNKQDLKNDSPKKNKNINDINAEYEPALIRESTFTKHEESDKQELKNDSPLESNTSYAGVIDTSKVNKRRRWDKSRQSVSMFDGSFDINNISAPWLKNDFDQSVNISNLDVTTKEVLEISGCELIRDLSTAETSFIKTRSSPSSTSTPFSKGKTNLLRKSMLQSKSEVVSGKKSLTRKQNFKENTSKIDAESNEKPRRFLRTNTPNFSLIHQKAQDKMESIKEMSERKAARAKLLLSGHKPPSGNYLKTSTKKKELKCSPNRAKSIQTNTSMSNISIMKINNISPSKSNLKVANKENKLALTSIEKMKEKLKAKSQIPKLKVPTTLAAEKKGFTRLGFKVGPETGVKDISKSEQIKAVVNKTKVVKNMLEERRAVIKGVRSNRRFELLMRMRNK